MDKPSADWCSFANCRPLEPSQWLGQGPKAGMQVSVYIMLVVNFHMQLLVRVLTIFSYFVDLKSPLRSVGEC